MVQIIYPFRCSCKWRFRGREQGLYNSQNLQTEVNVLSKKKGSSLGCFIIGLVVIWIATYVVSNLILGLPNLFVLFALLLTIFLIIASGFTAMIQDSTAFRKQVARPRDPSQIQRVIIDIYTNEEYIITGAPDETFRESSKRDWQFHSFDSGSAWIIKDEHGNDISNKALSSYNGIAKIESVAPMESRRALDDSEKAIHATEEYSDIDRGVEFYD